MSLRLGPMVATGAGARGSGAAAGAPSVERLQPGLERVFFSAFSEHNRRPRLGSFETAEQPATRLRLVFAAGESRGEAAQFHRGAAFRGRRGQRLAALRGGDGSLRIEGDDEVERAADAAFELGPPDLAAVTRAHLVGDDE